jgi:hypothetical protein
MMWVMYGGMLAGVVLLLVALVVAIPPVVRTQRQAKAIVPDALLAKFRKAPDDVERVQRAALQIEELVVRARAAVARLRAAVEVLRSLRVVPTPNRD